MAKLLRNAGTTSQILQVFIQDSSSSTGAGLAGLTSGTGGLVAGYHRNSAASGTAISLVSMTEGTFTSSGFVAMTGTGIPAGCYQFCPPNAAYASGASSVFIWLSGAANMAPCLLEIDLQAQIDGAAAADAVLDRDMSAGTDSGSPSVRTVRQALRALRNKLTVSGGTLTVCKEDDSTTSWTATVSTTSGANPVTGIDPA